MDSRGALAVLRECHCLLEEKRCRVQVLPNLRQDPCISPGEGGLGYGVWSMVCRVWSMGYCSHSPGLQEDKRSGAGVGITGGEEEEREKWNSILSVLQVFGMFESGDHSGVVSCLRPMLDWTSDNFSQLLLGGGDNEEQTPISLLLLSLLAMKRWQVVMIIPSYLPVHYNPNCRSACCAVWLDSRSSWSATSWATRDGSLPCTLSTLTWTGRQSVT